MRHSTVFRPFSSHAANIDSAIPRPAPRPAGRIPQVDYLKGILITLMVLFHLSWFSTYHLDVTRYVYVFHMSGFIILSGFFANTGKTPASS
ncbi:MAG: acyltransferase family protein [Akkermansia sp.]